MAAAGAPLRSRTMRGLVVGVALVLVACGPSDTGGGGDGDGGAGGVDAPEGATIDSGGSVADAAILPDASCGVQTEEIELIELGDPPDLLIVLDRSGSMALPPEFPFMFGDPTKWDIMRDALTDITTELANNIRFGLTVFPTHDVCGVNAGAAVLPELGSYTDIVSFMNSTSPDGNTPAHLALDNAAAVYQSIPSNPAGQYVLFATDGIPNCGGDPVEPDTASETETVTAVTALANMGIPTYVLGFGDILGLPTSMLNDAALAGGVPRPGGPPHYYHAANAADLEMALEAIAGGIIVPTCEYALAETPPDPDLVTVTIDGVPVPRDPGHNNGWDYHPDAMTITFFGSYCEMLEMGSAGEVSFAFGCPGPVVD
jgi:hypothetical protein